MTKLMIPLAQDGATSSASWVSIGKNFSDLLTSIGLPKTADTGQIDWSTVSRPASQTTVVGYEIREIPTTVGTLRMKIEYGSGSSTQQNYGWTLTFGTGSNGSGAITGAFTTAQFCSPNGYAWNITTPAPCYGSSWDGGFAICMWPSGTESYRYVLFFDQSCNDTGVLTDDGYLWGFANNSRLYTYGYSKMLSGFGTFTTFPGRIPYHYRDAVPSAAYNNKRKYSVLRQQTPKPVWHKNLLIGWASDVPLGATFTADVLGEDITYLSLGALLPGLNGNVVSASNDYTASLCMRWE